MWVALVDTFVKSNEIETSDCVSPRILFYLLKYRIKKIYMLLRIDSQILGLVDVQ